MSALPAHQHMACNCVRACWHSLCMVCAVAVWPKQAHAQPAHCAALLTSSHRAEGLGAAHLWDVRGLSNEAVGGRFAVHKETSRQGANRLAHGQHILFATEYRPEKQLAWSSELTNNMVKWLWFTNTSLGGITHGPWPSTGQYHSVLLWQYKQYIASYCGDTIVTNCTACCKANLLSYHEG